MFRGYRVQHGTVLDPYEACESWDPEEVDTKLPRRIVSACERVRDAAQAYDADWPTAAHIIALSRLELEKV